MRILHTFRATAVSAQAIHTCSPLHKSKGHLMLINNANLTSPQKSPPSQKSQTFIKYPTSCKIQRAACSKLLVRSNMALLGTLHGQALLNLSCCLSDGQMFSLEGSLK